MKVNNKYIIIIAVIIAILIGYYLYKKDKSKYTGVYWYNQQHGW